METRLGVQTLVNPLQDGVYISAQLWSLENPRNQDKVSKFSMESEYCVMSLTCFKILWVHGLLTEIGFVNSIPLPFLQIIQVQFASLKILSLMNAPNILRLIVILSEMSMIVKSSIFHMFSLSCSLLTSLLRVSPSLVMNFWFPYCYSLIHKHQFERDVKWARWQLGTPNWPIFLLSCTLSTG